MNRMKKAVSRIALVGMMGLALTACNGSDSARQFLKNVNLQVTEEDTASYLALISTFDLGNASLAQMDIPVMDPHTLQVVGSVGFAQLQGGVGQITLKANATLLLNADPQLGQVLPNGKPLPLALGVEPGQMMGVKILEHSTVYLGGDTRATAYAGVALGIKGFDQVMSQLQTPANVFFMQNFTPNVMGIGGIYGSNVPGESGIAIFGRYKRNPGKADFMSESDLRMDQEINQLNRATWVRLHRFFKGKRRTLQFY